MLRAALLTGLLRIAGDSAFDVTGTINGPRISAPLEIGRTRPERHDCARSGARYRSSGEARKDVGSRTWTSGECGPTRVAWRG